MPGNVHVRYLADVHQTNLTTRAIGGLKEQLRKERPASISILVELADLERATEFAANITEMGSNALRRWVKQNIYVPGAGPKLKRKVSAALQDKFLEMQSLLKTAKGFGIDTAFIPFDHPSTPSFSYFVSCISGLKEELKPFVEDKEIRQKLCGVALFELSYLLTMAALRNEYMAGLLRDRTDALRKADGDHIVYVFTGAGHTASLGELHPTQEEPAQKALGHADMVDRLDELTKRFIEAAAKLRVDDTDLVSFMKKLLADISTTKSITVISSTASGLLTDTVDKLLDQNDGGALDAALKVCTEYYQMAGPNGRLGGV